MEDGYIIDAKTRKKALKFKGEYEGLFKEMSGIMHRRADVVNAYMDGAGPVSYTHLTLPTIA